MTHTLPLFAWTPGIGDPTVGGWITVFAYFAAAYLCLRAFMAQKSGPARPYGASIVALLRVVKKHFPHLPRPARRAAFWLLLAFLLTFLGFNKQLDLQTLFTELGRAVARSQGWYHQRRTLQLLVIGGVSVIALVLLVALFVLTRKSYAEYNLALMGLTFVTSFVIIRALSFHNMDRFIHVRLLGVRTNFILEFSGIVLIGWCAVRSIARRKAERS